MVRHDAGTIPQPRALTESGPLNVDESPNVKLKLHLSAPRHEHGEPSTRHVSER